MSAETINPSPGFAGLQDCWRPYSNYRCFLSVLAANVTVWTWNLKCPANKPRRPSPNITLMLLLCFKMWICYCYTLPVPCHQRQQWIHSAVSAEVAGSRLLFAVIFSYILLSLRTCVCIDAGSFLHLQVCVQWGWNHLSIPVLSTKEWFGMDMWSAYNSICSHGFLCRPVQISRGVHQLSCASQVFF